LCETRSPVSQKLYTYSTLKATLQFDWKKVFRVPLQKPPA